MVPRVVHRLRDIKRSIAEIRALLADQTFASVQSNAVTLAAFERFLEILSEASRHVPDAWKAEHPGIPWRNSADRGNRIRHEYFRVDASGLWSIYQHDLDPLERAIDAMIAAHDPENPPS
jgi:uncharacterized protein with HEPN domain